MFGFHLLSARNLESMFDGDGSFFPDSLLRDLSGFNKKAELENATLLDTYRYKVNSLIYEQKVYRLKDNSIFVDTKEVKDTKLQELRWKLDEAVKNEDYESAAVLRDQLREYLKTN